ncbi:MAG: V-type ATP synthase subunit A, partial [Peptoniphilaceae bacterium]|nr:V-type ATP synthase subunit A [Peptoniphilaceae bacterium]
MKIGRIEKISGPLVTASGLEDANIYDVAEVSDDKLIGEIIEMRGDVASIQVYEETQGLEPGMPVYTTGYPLSVELGPGLLEKMYDGIQRPLEKLQDLAGDFLTRGVTSPPLDREKIWDFVAVKKVGDEVEAGDVLGTVKENEVVTTKILVPYGIKGKLKKIESGSFRVEDIVAIVEDYDTKEEKEL